MALSRRIGALAGAALALGLALVPVRAASPAPAGPVQPTWDSIKSHYTTPAWFQDAKFGIFIHWGLYAVPAHHNEWYARHMYSNPAIAAWHREHFGPQDRFGYKDFIPMFKAEHYDPDQWATLFKQSGARYVVPVAEHHDSFAMYDSNVTDWCAGKMEPKRDLLGDLAKAIRKQGLVFGVSSHRMEHHTFMYPALKMPTDVFDPKYAAFYGPPVPGNMNDGKASPAFQADWLARCKELVDKYKPQMFWFDNGVNDRAYDGVKLQFAAYYYNRAMQWKLPVSISTKSEAYLAGSIPDYEKASRAPKSVQSGGWQTDDQIGSTWGYVDGMTTRSSASVIGELADTVSKGGNLLLNISPRADGTIPDAQQRVLRDVGAWLLVNGDAIYGTRPSAQFADGAYRFTTRAGALYAICVGKAAPDAVLPSLGLAARPGTKIAAVFLLGQTSPLAFTQDKDSLHVTLPASVPAFTVLKITGIGL